MLDLAGAPEILEVKEITPGTVMAVLDG